METLVYESPYLKIWENKADSLIRMIYSEKSADYTTETYRIDILKMSETFIKNHPFKRSYCDTRSFFYAISVEEQEWVGHLFKDTSPPKSALVMSPEYIPQLSIEQTVEELGMEVKTCFFDSEEAAMKWLFS